jgi:hypothetical protein
MERKRSRETTWIKVNKLPELEYEKSIKLVLDGFKPIKVRATDNSVLEYVHTHFNSTDLVPDVEYNFYVGKDISIASQFGLEISDVKTPCVGYYTPDKKQFMTFGATGYGYLKSTIFGIASLGATENETYPSHGALLKIGDKGVLFPGYHGCGKTSMVLNLIARLVPKNVPIGFVTDDWATFSYDGETLYGQTCDKLLSFDEKLSDFFPELNLGGFIQRIPVGLKKLYMLPSEFNSEVHSISGTQVDYVFYLDLNIDSNTPLDYISNSEVSDLIVDSAYHMPCDEVLSLKMCNFWNNALRNKPLFSIQVKNEKTTLEKKIDELLQVIL